MASSKRPLSESSASEGGSFVCSTPKADRGKKPPVKKRSKFGFHTSISEKDITDFVGMDSDIEEHNPTLEALIYEKVVEQLGDFRANPGLGAQSVSGNNGNQPAKSHPGRQSGSGNSGNKQSTATSTKGNTGKSEANTSSGPERAQQQLDVAVLVGEVVPLLLAKLVPTLVTAVTVAVKAATQQMSNELAPKQARVDFAIKKANRQALLLRYEADRQEQYSRRESIRMFGIPESDKEDTTAKVVEVANKIGLAITSSDISVSHRSGRKGERPRPILCRFISRRHKDELLANKKKLKDMEGRISITEDLTPLRYKMLKVAQEQPDVNFAFTREGRIHCIMKAPEGERGKLIVIDSADDFFHLGMDSIDFKRLGLADFAPVDLDP